MEEFLKFELIDGSGITVKTIMGVLLALLFAKFLIWFLNGFLFGKYFKQKQIDFGRQASIRQFSSYIIWTLTTFSILELVGVSSMIWTAGAALLVGIGLGLQETFKDLISGVVILIEGTVEVGDIVTVNDQVGKVDSIGLRTSKVATRDRTTLLIPNSKFVVDTVANWSHDKGFNRFSVAVGVAYGSDVELVRDLLLQAVAQHPKALPEPVPNVQFRNFGDSSLDFEVYFFSSEFFAIEFVKSDIRFTIDKLFREHEVQIPFPQRDLWVRNAKDLK